VEPPSVIGGGIAAGRRRGCAILGRGNPKQFFFSWLVSFLFFLSLALGALFFVLIQYAPRGWGSWCGGSARRLHDDSRDGAALRAAAVRLHDLYEWSHPARPITTRCCRGRRRSSTCRSS
jgi:hypothetical protein